MTNASPLGGLGVRGLGNSIVRRPMLGVLLAFAAVASAFFVPNSAEADKGQEGEGQQKVTICHLADEGQPIEITIGAPGAANHLENHPGDSPGECANNCSFGGQCDDGNACTQNVCHDDNTCDFSQPQLCPDDGNPCTTYACDPVDGCVMNTVLQDGLECFFGDLLGVCSAGECEPETLPVVPCTEQGIADALAAGGGKFACDVPTKIVATAQIVIADEVILDGGGNLIIEGDGTESVVVVSPNVKAKLRGVKVTGGGGVDFGGGIHNEGTLTLTNSIVSGNVARIAGGGIYSTGMLSLHLEDGAIVTGNVAPYGGGIYNLGTATMSDCTVRKNVATSGGGGVYNDGALMLNNCIVSENSAPYGGGLWNNGTLVLNDGVVAQNVGEYGAGGILGYAGSVTLNSTVVTGNGPIDPTNAGPAGGIGVLQAATATLNRSFVSGNVASSGGGIASEGTVTLTSTTIAGNYARADGGGISSLGSLMLVNSTVSDNVAEEGKGGGIHNGGSLTVVNGTFVWNVGPYGSAIHNAFGAATVKNTLVVGPPSVPTIACVNESGASMTSGGYNIESPDDTCNFGLSTDQMHVADTELNLGPLLDNGGGMPTHMPLQGSVAVDAIPEPECVDLDGIPLLNDQRGVRRPQGAQCDVGAVEIEYAFACTEQGIREAIAVGGMHTFDCGGPTTVTTTAEIAIDNDVVLDGGGNLTIDGDNGHRVFSVAPDVTAELRGFTVSSGYAESGGGIYNQGTLTITSSTVSGNTAFGPYIYHGGGGIKNEGTLTLSASAVSSNTSEAMGGGIFSSFWDGPATLTLDRSQVLDNTAMAGGGLTSIEGTAALDNTIVSGNTAALGGGIATVLGRLTLTDTQVSSNTADSTLCQDPEICTLPGAVGGGILNDRSKVDLLRTEISWNRAGPVGVGGGIFNGSANAYDLDTESRMTSTNVTLSHNAAEGDGTVYEGIPSGTGGGIFNYGPGATIVATHGTTAHNTASHGGGAGYGAMQATGVIGSSLIQGDCFGDGTAPNVSLGNNIEGPSHYCLINPSGNDLSNVPEELLRLGPLQNNGGTTRTHELLDGSPAINRIPFEACVDAKDEPVRTDQRGVSRPRGDACDVGALENECGGCDDGDDCTSNVCTNGQCSYSQVVDGTTCDNGEGACQSGVCEPLAPSCEGVECADENECTSDVCDPVNGKCVNPPVADGTSCGNGAGSCQGGQCEPLFVPPCTDVDCNDNDWCTDDWCDPATGECVHANNEAWCLYAHPWIFGKCASGECAPPDFYCGAGVTCLDDGDPCTVELCDYQTPECLVKPAHNGTPCGSSGQNTCQGGHCQRSDFDLDLAYRWAPIHYQDVDASIGNSGIQDYITRVDYDGNWQSNDNWDHLTNAADLSAHVYYSVAETSTHWFIIYAFYHPRDWAFPQSIPYTTGDPTQEVGAEHENDMEGFLAFVRKEASDGSQFGELEGIVTVAHTDFYSYLTSQGLQNGIFAGHEDVDGFVQWEFYDGVYHPKTVQQAQGHGLKAFSYYPIVGDRVVYYPSRSEAEKPDGTDDDYVQYKLIDIFAPDGLYDHRTESETFSSRSDEWGKFVGDDAGSTCGNDGWGDFTWCDENAADAPWSWDDTGLCADVILGPVDKVVCIYEPDQMPKGALATQPARLVDNYFDGLGDFDRLYERNPYVSFMPIASTQGSGSGAHLSVVSYEVGGERYFLFADPGVSSVVRVRPDGTFGEVVQTIGYGGFTTLASYQVGGEIFVLMLRKSDGYWEIRRINPDGTLFLGEHVDWGNWRNDEWTDAIPYTVGGNQYIMFLKEALGTVYVRRLNADGSLGAEAYRADWDGGWWSAARFYSVGSNTYQYRYSMGNGLYQIHLMNSEGRSAGVIQQGATNFGYTHVEILTAGGATYLLKYSWYRDPYRVRINRLNPTGSPMGHRMEEQYWNPGWLSIILFETGNDLYLWKQNLEGDTQLMRFQPEVID